MSHIASTLGRGDLRVPPVAADMEIISTLEKDEPIPNRQERMKVLQQTTTVDKVCLVCPCLCMDEHRLRTDD